MCQIKPKRQNNFVMIFFTLFVVVSVVPSCFFFGGSEKILFYYPGLQDGEQSSEYAIRLSPLYVGIGLGFPPKIRLILFVHYEDSCFTAVSDNTRPAMSKTSLDFGFFCDVNQNLKLTYKVFPLCVLSIGTIRSLMFFCVMLISLARVSSETHNLQHVFRPRGQSLIQAVQVCAAPKGYFFQSVLV